MFLCLTFFISHTTVWCHVLLVSAYWDGNSMRKAFVLIITASSVPKRKSAILWTCNKSSEMTGVPTEPHMDRQWIQYCKCSMSTQWLCALWVRWNESEWKLRACTLNHSLYTPFLSIRNYVPGPYLYQHEPNFISSKLGMRTVALSLNCCLN